MMFRGLFGVLLGLHVMAVRHVRMVPGLFVIAGLVVFGSRAMVLGGVFMMFRGFQMMIDW